MTQGVSLSNLQLIQLKKIKSMSTKIQMVIDHQNYKKGQIIELEEKQAINFLTNGKALKIHRQNKEIIPEKIDEKNDEKISDKANKEEGKKSKKND